MINLISFSDNQYFNEAIKYIISDFQTETIAFTTLTQVVVIDDNRVCEAIRFLKGNLLEANRILIICDFFSPDIFEQLIGKKIKIDTIFSKKTRMELIKAMYGDSVAMQNNLNQRSLTKNDVRHMHYLSANLTNNINSMSKEDSKSLSQKRIRLMKKLGFTKKFNFTSFMIKNDISKILTMMNFNITTDS